MSSWPLTVALPPSESSHLMLQWLPPGALRILCSVQGSSLLSWSLRTPTRSSGGREPSFPCSPGCWFMSCLAFPGVFVFMGTPECSG